MSHLDPIGPMTPRPQGLGRRDRPPVDTHGRWPMVGAACLAPAWASVAARRRELGCDDAWIAGLALPILLAHQTEEWVRPGGFLLFANERLLGSELPTWPLTDRVGFHVNVTMGWATALGAEFLWRQSAAPAAFVLWIEAGNAVMHGAAALRERAYNPGLVTATALMATHAALGTRALHRSARLTPSGRAAAATAGIAFSLGLPLAMKLRMRRSM